MSEREGHNQDQTPIAALLRMAADGELPAEQEPRLRAHLAAHPGDAERIEFERRLRAACARACAPETGAPPALRDKVLARWRETADELGARAARTRSQGFWAGRMLVRFGAVAALIALVAVVAFQTGRFGQGPTGPGPGATIEQVARFARAEHGRCTGLPDPDNAKFTVETLDQLGAEFAAFAGRDISLGAVAAAESQGLHFVDAGRCHLPGGGTAMHIRFRTDGPGEGLISVWAQVDGTLELEEGLTYKAGEGCDCVRLWRVGEVRYVMVCSDDQEQPLAEKAMACPSQARACGTP
ncbi:MAG: hypothetical protein IT431_03050 [Phycisphaerales bacterium]|nr:hypothetical protein [Phycisphaerales bacterium]